MSWFKRKEKGITTATEDKMDIPKGLWYKSPTGKIIDSEELARNLWVSPEDDFHVRIGSAEYFEILFDNNIFVELDKNMTSKDTLGFVDTKKYADRIKDVTAKTGLKDAVRTGVGKSKGKDIVICCMDFAFIGGSMGAVVGEKIARGIDFAIKNDMPFIMISKSGGARTSAKLAQLAEVKLPYISLCTDPTTGGTTASYAMLGDINIAEPGALIGFAGPRVVRDTTGKDLPEGFQTSEFLLEHGFLDFISARKDLKDKINLYIDLIQNNNIR